MALLRPEAFGAVAELVFCADLGFEFSFRLAMPDCVQGCTETRTEDELEGCAVASGGGGVSGLRSGHAGMNWKCTVADGFGVCRGL